MELEKEELKFALDYLDENIADSDINKKVCIFGQGFVGLPLALSFSLRGCSVTGVDVNEKLVEDINNGITYHTEKFYEVPIQDILKEQLEQGKYRATFNSVSAVKNNNNIIVTVGIPIVNGNYKMDYLESACTIIGRNLKREDLVVIRSTVIPGTTEEVILTILERESGMKAGADFYLAYSSERIAEGRAFDEFANMPTLIAGINEESLKRAVKLLSVVCKAEIVPASCIKAVETSKVFENVQRDVNIAMSQEFARFAEALGIDIFEVIRLANTHKRVNLLTPGPGVGGYCIPNAYHYISPKAKELGVNLDLLKKAREKNAALPDFIVDKLKGMLQSAGKELQTSKIAVFGLAMKDYSNDDRISPPVDICKKLLKAGADVRAYDPVVPTHYDFKVNSRDEALKGADAVLILAVQHKNEAIDYEHMSKIMADEPVILDTRNIIDGAKAKKYGFEWWKI